MLAEQWSLAGLLQVGRFGRYGWLDSRTVFSEARTGLLGTDVGLDAGSPLVQGQKAQETGGRKQEAGSRRQEW